MMMIMLLQCEREKRGAVRKGEAEVHAKRAEEQMWNENADRDGMERHKEKNCWTN